MTEDQQKASEAFSIKRVFVKDFSFEAPGGANTFTNPWNPDVNVDVEVAEETLAEDVYEVVLTLTVTVNNADTTAFMIEVLQGGIFSCARFSQDQLHRILHTYCPNILFPYAREAIDSMVVKGSFPALMIEPVNFDALYNEHLGDAGAIPGV